MLSPKPWTLEAVLRLLLGVFLCIMIGTLLASLIPGGSQSAPVIFRRLIVSAFCFQGAALVLVHRFVRSQESTWPQAFGLLHAPGRAIPLGAVAVLIFLPIGLALQQGSALALRHFGIDPVAQDAVEALRHAGKGFGLAIFVLITVILAPLAEELLFRGIFYPALKRSGHPQLALWSTSLLFAAIHFNLASFVPLLVLAMVLVWLYERTDNLLAPITAHALFNTANLMIFFFSEDLSGKLPAPK